MKKILLSALFLLLSTALSFSATYVNDGSINWDGNWQTTGAVNSAHASTAVNVDLTSTQYSVGWSANTSNTNLGAMVFLHSITTIGTGRILTVALQQADDSGYTTNLIDQATTTLTTTSATKVSTWLYFKYGTAFQELTGKYYRIKITSDNADDTYFRVNSADGSKIAAIQVLSATGTPTTGDVTYTIGTVQASTANPASSTVTVNVNNTTNTFGNISVANGGTLNWGSSASSTYYIKTSGVLTIQNGGVVSVGTVATPIPMTSVATLAFTVATTHYVNAGGSLIAQGTGFTGNVHRTTSTDAIGSVGDRTFTVADDVSSAGWKTGDVISISGTSVSNGTYTSESKIISSVSGTSITITADWTRTHLAGAEVCNLSRSANLTGVTQVHTQFITYGNIDLDNTTVFQLGGTNDYSGLFNWENGNSTASIDTDYCVFNSSGGGSRGGVFYQFRTANPLDLTGNIFYNIYNGVFGTGSGVLVLRNTSVINTPISTSNETTSATVYAEDSNFYGGATNTMLNAANVEFVRCKFWESWYSYGGNYPSYTGFLLGSSTRYALFKDCKIGSDGTNTLNVGAVALDSASVYLYNTSVSSSGGAYYFYPASSYANLKKFPLYAQQNYGQTNGRYKTTLIFGDVSDQITGGQVAGWARGGAGLSVYLNPTSATSMQTVGFSLYIPVTASTDPQIKFYVKTTQTSSGPTLNVDVYDSDDNSTLLVNNASIDLTSASDWTQYSVASISPSSTGFVRVVLKALNGSSTGDIGIDDISFVSGGTTYTDSCDRSADGLPLIFGTAAAGPGGASTHASGMAF